MLQLTGNIHDVYSAEFTNRETGVISRDFKAEILHKSNGKTEILTLKVDASAFESWLKVKGRDMMIEVRPYALKSREGGIVQGLALADKKSLPSILRAAVGAAAAAA